MSRFVAVEGGFWVSGDYESATDNLNPSLSEACLDEIWHMMGFPIEDLAILNCTMSGHDIDYSEVGYGVEKQKWGQLMGSPLSFPILCIINAAVTRLAFETAHGRTMSLVDTPMTINGDDVLFYSHSDECYSIWKDLTAAAGLKFSLGKNYTSADFAMINSVLFRTSTVESLLHLDEDIFGLDSFREAGLDDGPTYSEGCFPPGGCQEASVLSHTFRRVPYVNLGLMFGQSKVLDVSDDLKKRAKAQRGPNNVGSCGQALVSGFSGDVRENIISQFISRNSSLLRDVPAGVDWFLPKFLGGLGLPIPRDYEISDKSRKIAAWMYCLDVEKYSQLTLASSSPVEESYLAYSLRQEKDRIRCLRYPARFATVRDDNNHPRSMASSYWYLGIGTREENVRDSIAQWRKSAQQWSKKGLAHGLEPLSMATIRQLSCQPRFIEHVGSGKFSPVSLVC